MINTSGRRREAGAERPDRDLASPGRGGVGWIWSCAVALWRYGLTLFPVGMRPADERDETRIDEVLRARSEDGWELLTAGTARDGSDVLVFRQPAD